jgi:carboxypeptidase C (cathepsin A)
VYLNEELEYISASPFIDLNDQVFRNWNFSHVDPTGAEKGGPDNLYTAGDLAASMSLNPYLKVFLASGYYDAVTPFLQTDSTSRACRSSTRGSAKTLSRGITSRGT